MIKKVSMQKFLKHFIDFLWYGGLLAGLAITVFCTTFLLSAAGIIKVEMPVVDIKMQNYEYRFNSNFVEVRRIDSIVGYFIQENITKEILSSPGYVKEAIAQLYKLNIDQLNKFLIDSDQFNKSQSKKISPRIILTPHKLLPLRYFTHSQVPRVLAGVFMFMLFLTFCVETILFNIRKIFEGYISDNTFTKPNALRLQVIGIYFFLLEAVRFLIFFGINSSVAKMEWFNSIPGSYGFSFGDINYLIVFSSLVFLILAGIFRMGSTLKEENDLTV